MNHSCCLGIPNLILTGSKLLVFFAPIATALGASANFPQLLCRSWSTLRSLCSSSWTSCRRRALGTRRLGGGSGDFLGISTMVLVCGFRGSVTITTTAAEGIACNCDFVPIYLLHPSNTLPDSLELREPPGTLYFPQGGHPIPCRLFRREKSECSRPCEDRESFTFNSEARYVLLCVLPYTVRHHETI